jgi:hypothetical protein
MHRSKYLLYSITSSARPRSESGTVRPSALAVLRLMIRRRRLGRNRLDRPHCWALAASGQATAAPPSAAMNARRRRQILICSSPREGILSTQNSAAQPAVLAFRARTGGSCILINKLPKGLSKITDQAITKNRR